MTKKSLLYRILFLVLFVFILILAYFYYSFFYFSFNKDYNFAWENVPKNYKEILKKEYEFSFTKLYKIFIYKYRYKKYIPYIEKKLLENNLPLDLKYIPILESSLKIDALSDKWALGLWQFMPETWKWYGLIVNESIDERIDFFKSTDAWIEYIKYLYNKFWDWWLVLASYNRWENAIIKAMGNQWVDNYFDLELNDETSRYFYKIVWIKDIFE